MQLKTKSTKLAIDHKDLQRSLVVCLHVWVGRTLLVPLLAILLRPTKTRKRKLKLSYGLHRHFRGLGFMIN